MILEDLDFADDLALLSHTHGHMQEKTSRLSFFAQQVGLRISPTKTEVMTLNVTNPSPITVDGVNLPMREEFTYLSSVVRQDGGAGTDSAKPGTLPDHSTTSESHLSTKSAPNYDSTRIACCKPSSMEQSAGE